MKSFSRAFAIWLLLGFACAAWSQTTGQKITRVDIKFVGPASVSEQFIRSNLRPKAGSIYHAENTQDDVQALYTTGQFFNIRVSVDPADDGGVILTYIVQARPRISEIKLEGNKKLSDSKLKKKITVKVGDPLDEQKLFNDCQEMEKLYEKYGYPGSQVKYVPNIDEASGRGSVTYHVTESPKVKISKVEFIGAAAFTQKELRKQIKTEAKWMFSWLTGSGVFKEEDYTDDRDRLADFYHNHGYLDFEIKDVKFDHPKQPNLMVVRFYIFEGRQYKVGAITFSGTTLLPTNAITPDFQAGPEPKPKSSPAHRAWLISRLFSAAFPMKAGNIFTPDNLEKDKKAIREFYGSRGYVELSQGLGLNEEQIPNVDNGTMDLKFTIEEGQKSYVEKIDIRGNTKTRDKVLRRELAISPGEIFDMGRVEISKHRLENLGYFSKVETQPEATDPPIAGRKNLIVSVEEQNTGNFTLGAGFSSVDALVGYVEVSQANFDLLNPPTFTGGGQKIRLRVQLGTKRQDYELSFVEPWFLNHKLQLGVDLYRHQLNFESPNSVFDETRTGMKVSVSRALGSDFLIGTVSYTVEQIGISLNPGWHGNRYLLAGTPPLPYIVPPNVPQAILEQTGDHFFQRFGASLAYDTRNSVTLPNHGQRSDIETELSVGDTTFYKIEAKTAWYFPGLFKGHVLEIGGRAGIANSLSSGDVPFYDRYYLGGLYSMRAFDYRNVSPRQPFDPSNPTVVNEPIGGDSYWFGSAEYSVPIIEKEDSVSLRFALFYDAGAVGVSSTSFSGFTDTDWGVGIRLNIPKLGPLRLDYAIPIRQDQYNQGGPKFQFGAGYTREF